MRRIVASFVGSTATTLRGLVANQVAVSPELNLGFTTLRQWLIRELDISTQDYSAVILASMPGGGLDLLLLAQHFRICIRVYIGTGAPLRLGYVCHYGARGSRTFHLLHVDDHYVVVQPLLS